MLLFYFSQQKYQNFASIDHNSQNGCKKAKPKIGYKKKNIPLRRQSNIKLRPLMFMFSILTFIYPPPPIIVLRGRIVSVSTNWRNGHNHSSKNTGLFPAGKRNLSTFHPLSDILVEMLEGFFSCSSTRGRGGYNLRWKKNFRFSLQKQLRKIRNLFRTSATRALVRNTGKNGDLHPTKNNKILRSPKCITPNKQYAYVNTT